MSDPLLPRELQRTRYGTPDGYVPPDRNPGFDVVNDAHLTTDVRDVPGYQPVGVLPTEAKTRKGIPMATGLLDYFPDALADVARLSKIGNDQHNPGQPTHWAREKSTDHADCIMRHMADRNMVDNDGVLHATKVAWRALAQLQLRIEKMREDGVTYPPTGAR